MAKYKPYFFDFESSVTDEDDNPRILTIEAANTEDIYVFERGHFVSWRSLPEEDRDKISDRVEKHFFQEDAYQDKVVRLSNETDE